MAIETMSFDELKRGSPTSPKGPSSKPLGNMVSFDEMKGAVKKPEAPSEPGYLDRVQDAVVGAGKALGKDLLGAATGRPHGDPVVGAGKAVVAGGVQLGELAASGLSALVGASVAKAKGEAPGGWGAEVGRQLEQNQDHFRYLHGIAEKITGVNTAPADKTDAAMSELLGVIPGAVDALGDDQFEKTGSAVWAAGVKAAGTLLMLKPQIASRMMGKAADWVKPKGGVKTPAMTGFEELAATDPAAAQEIVDHVAKADPKLAAALQKRWAKFSEASEKELDQLAKDAAKARIAELTPPTIASLKKGLRRSGTKEEGTEKSSAAEEPPPEPPKGGGGGKAPVRFPVEETRPSTEGIEVKEHSTAELDPRTGKPWPADMGKRPVAERREAMKHGWTPAVREETARGLAKELHEDDFKASTGKPPTKSEAAALAKEREKLFSQPATQGDLDKFTERMREKFGKDVKVTKLPKDDNFPRPPQQASKGAAVTTVRGLMDLLNDDKWLSESADRKFEKEFTSSASRLEDQAKDPPGQTRHKYIQDILKHSNPADFLDESKALARMAEKRGKKELAAAIIEHTKSVLKDMEAPKYKFQAERSLAKRAEKIEKQDAEWEKFRQEVLAKEEAKKAAPPLTTDQAGAALRTGMKEVHEASSAKEKAKGAWGMGEDPIIYMNAGIPVTRTQIESAFRLGAEMTRRLPGVRIAEGKLTEYANQMIRTIAPESLGPNAKGAGAIIAKAAAEEAHATSSQWNRAQTRRDFWNQRLPEAREFISGFEKGKKFADPILEKAAAAYRAWNRAIFEGDMKLGLKYEALDNYLYHTFENGDKVAEYFAKKYGVKWGDPGFTKDRSFDLYEEAIKAGFKPKYTNPEDIMLARQHASDTARMKVQVLEDLRQNGLAMRVPKGGGSPPPGFTSTNWRSPNGQHYWVQKEADVVMGNYFNTKSLWEMEGMVGDAFKGAMGLKNKLVPIKLALSLFHPLHVATIDNATGMVRAVKGLAGKTLSMPQAFGEFAKSLLYRDIYKNPKGGYRLLKAFQGKLTDAELTANDRTALQFMMEGGMIPELSSQYRMKSIESFRDAVNQGKKGAAAWHAPWAAIDAVQGVMFEKWIPSLKIASYLKDVAVQLKNNPELLNDPLARGVALRKLAKSIDNRYGEMAYNTLFWPKYLKDIAVGSSLSLGWNLGFIREYGGGALELGKAATTEGSVRGKIAKGDMDKALFVTFYSAQALAYGGLLTWALSGKAPQSLIDYTHPAAGPPDERGKVPRINTMFYPREFMAIAKRVEQEGAMSGMAHLAEAKASPVLGLVHDWWTNTNLFGQEISSTEAPAYKRLEQKLAYTFREMEPMSFASGGDTAKSRTLALAGFTPAPKYITDSPTEAAIKHEFQTYHGQKQTPYEKALYSDDSKKLHHYYETNQDDKYDKLLDDMETKYELSPGEMKRLEKSAQSDEDHSIKMFARLSDDWRAQKRLLDKMTPEEREVYLPHSNKDHLRDNYEPPEERK